MASKLEKEYEQVYYKTPFVVPNGFKFELACCDCGLVHKWKVKKVKSGIRLELSRVPVSTKALRKCVKYKKR